MAETAEKEILGVRSRASEEIAKKLRSIHDRDYYSVLGDFFEASAISVKNAVDLNDRDVYEKRFADIAKSYGEKGMKIFAECLSLFTDEIHAAIHGNAMFRDFAGELYMASGTNSKGLGQFFTPYHFDRPQGFHTKQFQKNFDLLVLRNGYRADSPKITLKNPKIRVGTGRPEWGAEHGKLYFVISWDN